MPKVRKAVIPVAGFGTRFLPATKASPKEMLPVIDKPVIQYIVEEAVASGITDIILVTNQSKRAVEDHFDDNPSLEAWLKRQGKKALLEEVRGIGKAANFIYIRQKGAYGNATPVLNARHLIGDEPFAVLFGDELVVSKVPRLRQLLDVHERYGDPVLGTIEVDADGTKKYGIIDPAAEVETGVIQVKGMVEKPGPERAPSRLAAIGTYVLTPDIFDSIEKTRPGHGGEIVLLDAIARLMRHRPVYAKAIDGLYFDTGSKIGWLEANLAIALERPDLAHETRGLVKKLAKR
jgi:UTP--glucose-1-phosphate uridylyltransferase